MSSAWLLPEHIADVLPAEAGRIEGLRQRLLGLAGGYGYELVVPPLVEHLESLVSLAGGELDLKTFKLVDQLSGRSLGLRADTTLQAARIDAHLLNRDGLTRLCYCGPVLHARPQSLFGTREPLQFGVEIYGHPGLEADLEVQDLALGALAAAGIDEPTIDFGDARLLRAVLSGVPADADRLQLAADALSAKDAAGLAACSADFPERARAGLRALLGLYGDSSVLAAARAALPPSAAIDGALDDLAWLSRGLAELHPRLRIGFDLADAGGYSYYSGVRFAVYGAGAHDAIARGGRYDEIGAAFGRNRPAAGFSLDVKRLADLTPAATPRAAIRAPWRDDAALRGAIRRLRHDGETVICVLPGHQHEADEFTCDRELVGGDGRWTVAPLRKAPRNSN